LTQTLLKQGYIAPRL